MLLVLLSTESIPLANAGACVNPRTSRMKENKETQKEVIVNNTVATPVVEQVTEQATEANTVSTPMQTTPDLIPSPQPEINTPNLTIKDDPQYKEWFRKLKYGANREQLCIAMKAQGLDPDLLETPDMPVLGGGQGEVTPPHPLLNEDNLVEEFSSSSLSDNSPDFSD